jgi:hypothetical protein
MQAKSWQGKAGAKAGQNKAGLRQVKEGATAMQAGEKQRK